MSLNRRIADHQAAGLLGAFSAYLVWGLQPIYWKYFAGLDSWIVIAHRYCWSCVFLILVLFFSGKLELVRNTCVCLLKKKLDFLFLCLISILAVLNWGINIYAPMAGHVVELGMGLFLTPLMSVVLGVIFYRERLNCCKAWRCFPQRWVWRSCSFISGTSRGSPWACPRRGRCTER